MRLSKLILAIVFCTVLAVFALIIASHVPATIAWALAALGAWVLMIDGLDALFKVLNRAPKSS